MNKMMKSLFISLLNYDKMCKKWCYINQKQKFIFHFRLETKLLGEPTTYTQKKTFAFWLFMTEFDVIILTSAVK